MTREVSTLKENPNIKLLADDEGQHLATVVGNMLPINKSYHHPPNINIRWNVKGRRKAFVNTMW